MKFYKILACLIVAASVGTFFYEAYSLRHYRTLCVSKVKEAENFREQQVVDFYKEHGERDKELDALLGLSGPVQYTKLRLNNMYRECLAQHGLKPEDLYQSRP